MYSRISVSLLILLALSLAGCNGQEDFSDAILGGPIIDGDNPNPNFNPDDACQSRVVGNLVDSGIVANIGYECGGYRGYTGSKGIPGEVDQNRFVCPLYSTSVRFFLGGRNDPREYLGTANFRLAGPASENFDEDGNNTCQYNLVSQEYEPGSVYDADGPYLFSLADLYDGPVRVDVITDNEPNEQAAQNLSALLAGLNTSTDESLVQIDDEAHRIILDVDFAFPDDFFDKPFADFVANDGDAQDYLDLISPGAKNAVWPPAETDVETVLIGANSNTAAGIYQFDLRQENYGIAYFLEQAQLSSPDAPTIFNAEALLTDYLAIRLQASGTPVELPSGEFALVDPTDGSSVDTIPFRFAQDFFPFTLVDRHNRLIGGGAYDVTKFDAAGNDHLCGEEPVYLALADSTGLNSDLTFDSILEPVAAAPNPETGSVSVGGRFIEGVAYSNVKLNSTESQSDYEVTYREPTHLFDNATDQSLIDAAGLCASTFSDQPIFGYRRQGIVMPKLDSLIMNHFFVTSGPGQYTLDYLARQVVGDLAPDVVSKDSLKVTIHGDGSIFTDLNSDGNPSYESDPLKGVPAGERTVGMVSSVIPGEEDPATPIEEYFTEAQINILVFTMAPQSFATTLPAYGSHFRARIVPDTTCAATNAIWRSGDDTLTQKAYWFDAYNITNWFRGTTEATTLAERYEAFRTMAYGYIEGVRTDCP